MVADRYMRSPAGRRSLPPLWLAVPSVAATWALLFQLRRFIDIVFSEPGATDFRRFYAGAEVGTRFGWPQMYDVAALREVSLPLGPEVGSDPFSLFNMNPPIVNWVVLPLTLLPLSVALLVWSGVNLASFVGASRLVFPGGGHVWMTTLLVSLAIWPAAFSLERGQMEPIVYGLAIVSWWMAERGKQRWAGVFLALAMAFKPQDVYLLPLIFLFCGMFRAAAWWLLTSASLLSLFALVVGAKGIGTDIAVIWWSARTDPSFIARPFVTPFGPDLSLLVGQGLIALVALAAAWRQRRSLAIAFAIGLVGTLSSGVHLHVYDYVGLAVAAWLVISKSELSLLGVGWLGLGVVCAQLTAIQITWPILVWELVWIVILGARRPQTIPSSQRASSDMRSGVHTGS